MENRYIIIVDCEGRLVPIVDDEKWEWECSTFPTEEAALEATSNSLLCRAHAHIIINYDGVQAGPELPPEFLSGNSVQVERAALSRERMLEILRATTTGTIGSKISD